MVNFLKFLKYVSYPTLPLLSIFGILGISWMLAAVMEIYTNNLTMLKMFEYFTIKQKYKWISKPPFPGNEKTNIFWFVQISDIHISKYRSYGQVEDLNSFCKSTLNIIKPDMIIFTGDLTDAKDKSLIGSSQYEEEWITYSNILQKCRSYPIFDLRGNHDAFAVAHHSSAENLFERYGSNKGKFIDGVYHYKHQKAFGIYSFIGVDFTPMPGPSRPFNFFGVPQEKTLLKMQEVSQLIQQDNATIWYGHYPLSVTTNPHRLRSILSTGLVYLCGHLHTLLGTFPQMHAVHSDGFLELELGDWKENRRYRVGVLDHDMFSFKDISYFSDRPVVIITNPVDARYMVPDRKSYGRTRNSTHIRFLVFHTSVTKSSIYVDDEVICTETVAHDNLHACWWDPHKYIVGVHDLKVLVKDIHGVVTQELIQFSLDGTRPPLGLFSVILLMTDFCMMARMVFLTSIFLTIIFPLVLKIFWQHQVSVFMMNFIKLFAPQLINTMNCGDVFWTIMAYNFYICFGPLSIGFFIPDQLSIMFSFGIVSVDQYIPGSLTYVYVGWQLLVFNTVMYIYLGEILNETTDISLRRLYWQHENRRFRSIMFHAVFLFFLWDQMTSIKMFYIAYGALSVLLNPIKTGAIFLSFYSIYVVKNKKRTS